MIRILIVDDCLAKRSRISKAILDSHNISKDFVVEVGCVKDARRKLYKEIFDLMILDLVLPVESDGECSPQNAISFLAEVGYSPSIKCPIHIVGMSGYKEEVVEHNSDFQSKLWNLIVYEEHSSAWEDQLKSIIFHLVKTRQQFINASLFSQIDFIKGYVEKNELPDTVLGIEWRTISSSIANIVERALEVPQKFSNGSKAKNINFQSMKIGSEYDFQNLIHLVLRPWLPSTEAENTAVIFDGNTKNADFSIKGNRLIIEAKFIDSTGKKNDVLKTLDGLKRFYISNANVKALLFLILVEKHVEIDKHKIEDEFSQISSEPSVVVKVMFNT